MKESNIDTRTNKYLIFILFLQLALGFVPALLTAATCNVESNLREDIFSK